MVLEFNRPTSNRYFLQGNKLFQQSFYGDNVRVILHGHVRRYSISRFQWLLLQKPDPVIRLDSQIGGA
mgnify:CR=1 FL=1